VAGGLYHDGNRELQDRFDSRRIADRLEQVNLRQEFNDEQRSIVESAPMFLLATADAEGWPDVSHKGGLPGFVRVVEPSVLAFPDYDGNGMFKSLGNVLVNPRVGMLFIRWGESPRRVRVQGLATVGADDELIGSWPGAQLVVRVHAERIFTNCPRYIHHMELVAYSRYVPREEHEPPVPDWKRRPEYRDALPARDG
jgi:uncharacterized protein